MAGQALLARQAADLGDEDEVEGDAARFLDLVCDAVGGEAEVAGGLAEGGGPSGPPPQQCHFFNIM